MFVEQLIRIKKEKGYSCRQLSELSGVPLGTVQKIFSGITKNPRHETLEALEGALCDYHSPKELNRIDYRKLKGPEAEYLNESVPYKTEERLYTIDDYFNLPDDRRAELIDGVFYDMATPAIIHQIIVGELHIQFVNCIKSHAKNCRVLLSPVCVRLDMDNYTMVEPDLVVVCALETLPEQYIDGAPDLAIEVLSPSTRRKDMTLKMRKYREAGVREYWIVDPKAMEVMVYDFSDYKFPVIYKFTDDIPVIISKGMCTVTLREVVDDIARQPE